jgi:hypothetical protein
VEARQQRVLAGQVVHHLELAQVGAELLRQRPHRGVLGGRHLAVHHGHHHRELHQPLAGVRPGDGPGDLGRLDRRERARIEIGPVQPPEHLQQLLLGVRDGPIGEGDGLERAEGGGELFGIPDGQIHGSPRGWEDLQRRRNC